MTQILAFGEPLAEFNQTRPDSAAWQLGYGGDTSNFCIAAARQGAEAGYIGAVGEDRFGDGLRQLWEAEQVEHTHVLTDEQAPTGVYFVSHDASGHHFDYLRAGSAASRYAPDRLPRRAIASARALHLSGISLAISQSACDAGLAAMEEARAAGVMVSFDTNLRLRLWPLARARAVMREALRMCEVCLPSWDDVTALLDCDDRDFIVDTLLGYGVELIALKMGAQGCYVATLHQRTLVPAYAVEAVDATGAGDCFGGAFVARLVAGDDAVAAARYANVAAALSTTGYGAVASIPHAAAVYGALEKYACAS
ncbi:2-dehydro-3-deoxygluconokinase [Dyella sp. SG562]|uniref:sugar kinase n=1 Tax=Dyella TaxID=231454 RepID=UPI00141E5766|nr:sugar kinase [Dyella sp. SG562]NII72796.1 2-dehydro-3-deoxygluconokinase [Dyella sp. SG562]